MSLISSLIPKQHTGSEKNFFQQRTYLTEAAAHAGFEIAKIRLLHVGCWHQAAGKASAVFFLFDQHEMLLNRTVQQGDYVRIGIPGPRSKAGSGFDWVYVEALREEPEAVAMRVRPCEAPEGKGIAHFLHDEATSTFAVWQDGLNVCSAIFGRNEAPNLDQTDSLLDKLRNLLVGTSAIAGAADAQWTALAKGLIDD